MLVTGFKFAFFSHAFESREKSHSKQTTRNTKGYAKESDAPEASNQRGRGVWGGGGDERLHFAPVGRHRIRGRATRIKRTDSDCSRPPF